MAAPAKAMGSGEWALLFALSALWGGSFFFGKVALAELPPLVAVLGRVGLAAVALQALAAALGHRVPTDRRTWAAFAVMGALNNLIPFGLIFWGQTRIASGLAAVLNAATPLFAVALAHLFGTGERLTPGRLVGVLLGAAGVCATVGPGALAGGGDALAHLAVLGAALSYALAGRFGRRFREVPPLVTAGGQLTAGAALLLPVVCLVERPWALPPPGAGTLAALGALALLCTALAYVIYFRLLAAAGPTNLLLVTFLIPVTAVALGAAVLGERFGPWQLGGAGLIAGGLAAIDGRPVRYLKARFGPAGPRAHDYQI